MIAYFLVGRNDIRIVGGGIEANGTCTDFVVPLREGEPFKNLPYAERGSTSGNTIQKLNVK